MKQAIDMARQLTNQGATKVKVQLRNKDSGEVLITKEITKAALAWYYHNQMVIGFDRNNRLYIINV